MGGGSIVNKLNQLKECTITHSDKNDICPALGMRFCRNELFTYMTLVLFLSLQMKNIYTENLNVKIVLYTTCPNIC